MEQLDVVEFVPEVARRDTSSGFLPALREFLLDSVGGGVVRRAGLLDPNGLIAWSDIDDLVNHSGSPVNVVLEGETVAEVDAAGLVLAIMGGATVQLADVMTKVASLRDVGVCLSKAVGGESVDASIYIAPEDAGSFGVHWDYVDVVAVQVYGSKSWKFYDLGDDAWPVSEHWEHIPDGYLDGLPIASSHTMVPGDAMYVPRGTPHAAGAVSGSGCSVHVSFRFARSNGRDFFDWLKDQLIRRVQWREPWPWKIGTGPSSDRLDWLEALINDLHAFLYSHSVAELLQRFERHRRSKQPSRDVISVRDVTASMQGTAKDTTTYHFTSGFARVFVHRGAISGTRLRYEIDRDAEGMTLEILGHLFSLDSAGEQIVRYIVRNPQWTIGEMAKEVSVEDGEIDRLMARLLRAGVISTTD